MALKGNQYKLDKNKNGKIDAQDFKMMKKMKYGGGCGCGKTMPKYSNNPRTIQGRTLRTGGVATPMKQYRVK
tara:strand:- start:147 stop:362 length:216 start_codon:yes stop_codon:yes gene_type:complete